MGIALRRSDTQKKARAGLRVRRTLRFLTSPTRKLGAHAREKERRKEGEKIVRRLLGIHRESRKENVQPRNCGWVLDDIFARSKGDKRKCN